MQSPRPGLSLQPLLYFALAHAAAFAAFTTLGASPARYAGFYYHPHLIALVHLITLGWITGSILGALLLIGPMALRVRRRRSRIDGLAFWLFAAGLAGMVSHFWLHSAPGMIGSAGTLALALLLALGRTARDLRGAALPWPAKLPFALGFLNLLLATAWGIVLGINRIVPLLGPLALANLFAHVHLATLGWGTLLVLGAGYRLLPMLLPSAMPGAKGVTVSVLLLEAGVLGVFAALLAGWPLGLRLAALAAAGGIATFLGLVAWMLRHPRPAPRERRLPDWGVLHTFQALAYLALATGAGLLLAWSPDEEWSIRYGAAYGVLGLVGFLTQIVVGVQGRLIPLYGWFLAYEASGHAVQPPSPHQTPARGLQAATFVLWTVGVPLLAAGFGFARPTLLGAGAWVLAAGIASNAAALGLALRRATSRS